MNNCSNHHKFIYLKIFIFNLLVLFTPQIKAQVVTPENYQFNKDIVYSSVGEWQGKLDLFVPKDLKKQVPLLINIHGGGWVHGQKETEKSFDVFFENGYVIANVEYRLAQQAPAPAAISDVRNALIYLVNNAAKYHIDKSKIIILGASAGGHLALMAGLLGNNHIFDGSYQNIKLPKIAAIIDKYGPTNLSTWDSMYKPGKASSSWLGGRGGDSVFVKSLSPVNYIGNQSPPIFIVHGDQDHTVPYLQSLSLYDALNKTGRPVEMYTVKDGMHGNFKADENKEINRRIMPFLEKALK